MPLSRTPSGSAWTWITRSRRPSTCGRSACGTGARLLLALLAPGAGRAALDRAALLVPRNGRAAGVLRGPRGDGLQRAVREDAVLPLLDPRHARLAHRHPGPGEGGRGVRGAARVERRDLLEPHPCMSSPRGSGERWTA